MINEVKNGTSAAEKLKQVASLIGVGLLASWIIGYSIWVIYTLRFDLGWLDPWDLKGRATVSGLLPTVLLFCLYPLGLMASAFHRWLKRDISGWEGELHTYLKGLSTIFVFLFLFFHWFASEESPWSGRFLWATVVCLVLASWFAGKKKDRLSKFFAVAYPVFAGVTLLVGYSIVYAWFVFPPLPDELGGPGSKCIVLDMDLEDYPSETIKALAARPTLANTTVRSKPIQLILETKEFFYLRLRATDATPHSFHRLPRTIVKYISSCPE